MQNYLIPRPPTAGRKSACATTCNRRHLTGFAPMPHQARSFHFDAIFIIFYICTRTPSLVTNATYMFTNRSN